MRRIALLLSVCTLLLLLSACNTFKYVPAGQYLLHSVKLQQKIMLPSDVNYNIYLHQVPNERFLNFLDLNLGLYNMSGRDTSKWINRTLRKLGEEPVIYDQAKNERSRLTLENLMINEGYFNAIVQEDVQFKKRRAYVTITMDGNKTLTANFASVNYTLTVVAAGNGSTSPAAGTYSYASGTQVTVTATATDRVSGTRSVSVRFTDSVSFSSLTGYLTLKSGTGRNGTWKGSIHVPLCYQAGTYVVSNATLYDTTGNYRNYDPGFTDSFKVTS